MIAKHLIVSGRVQGVGYRMHMIETAGRLGVTGWVRNRRDGSVEAVVCGDEKAVADIIGWAQRGPHSAVVTDVKVSAANGTFDGFAMLATA